MPGTRSSSEGFDVRLSHGTSPDRSEFLHYRTLILYLKNKKCFPEVKKLDCNISTHQISVTMQ
jgi:hypothetical protein